MNAEQTLRAVLTDEAATMRPSRDALAVIERRAARRSRPGWLVPALAGAVVLALIAVVVPTLRQPRSLGPVDAPYRREGVVWPFATTADALAWRRFPEGAPELGDPESAAREFAKLVLGPDAGVEAVDGGWRPTLPDARVDSTIVVKPGQDGKAPYVVVAVRSDRLSVQRPGDIRHGTVVRLRGSGDGGTGVNVLDRYGPVGGGPMDRDGDAWRSEIDLRVTPRLGHGTLVAGLRGPDYVVIVAIPVTFAEHRQPGPVGTPPVAVMYAVDERKRLVEVDTATGAPRRVFTPPLPLEGPEPRGLHLTRTDLYYSIESADRCTAIRAIRLSDGSDREVVRAAWFPAVSPDGTRLAYVRRTCAQDGPGHLVVRDLRSGAERVMPVGTLPADGPASWTPDGRSLVFTAEENGRMFSVVIDVDTARSLDDARPVPVAADAGCKTQIHWYAGERLVAVRTCGTARQVVVVDPASGVVRETLLTFEASSSSQGQPGAPTDVESFAVDASGRHALAVEQGLEFERWTRYGPSLNWVPGDYRSTVW